MCGISGTISLSKEENIGHIQETLLHKMLMKITGRRPDGSGIIIYKDYAFGNVRLSIVGGDQGKQPIFDQYKNLIFNGEIYNYKDLQK